MEHFVIEALQRDVAPVTCAIVKTPLKLGETKRFPCTQGVTGRVVRIRLLGVSNRKLVLCEVKVYGKDCKSPFSHQHFNHFGYRMKITSEVYVCWCVCVVACVPACNIDVVRNLCAFMSAFVHE